MKILFKRSQSAAALFSLVPLKFGSSVGFSLHAELELDEEEARLIEHYQFADQALVVSDTIDDLRQAFRPALLLGFLSFVVTFIFLSWSTSFMLAMLVTVVMTGVYFKALREQILVSDLMNGGRRFRCDSVVELIKKEAFLEGVCGYLRQVLESAKHWSDREAIEIKPLDKAEAKRAVMSASMSG